MHLQTLNPSKYKRFFAFGCSFTHYKWPTWADILGSSIPYYSNWGWAGRGNQFIFNSVMECDAKHNFTKDDLVIIMWTKANREDRYHNGYWQDATPNNLINLYGKEWTTKFAGNDRSNLIRDLGSIKATRELLVNRGCDWTFLNWAPLTTFDASPIQLAKFLINKQAGNDLWIQQSDNLSDPTYVPRNVKHLDVINTYRDVFYSFNKSMYGVGLFKETDDPHPTPAEHFYYLQCVWPDAQLNPELANWNMSTIYNRPNIDRL